MFHKKGIDFEEVDLGAIKSILHTIGLIYGCKEITELYSFNFYKLNGIIYGFNGKVPDIIKQKVGLSEIPKPSQLGIPLLMVTERKVVPMLPLGQYMVKACHNVIHLPEALASKVLYGKTVIIKDSYSFWRGLLRDKRGDFLAFLKLRKLGNETEIIPELDIGWYLREGG
ncbi:hypothetical protein GWK48_05155 [Metallosphaera tengchongensis]|uniref:Uncharacterized protein n=1 Tax=Metallosphaera tengchongensis TaxID=1532350 RepID=A0A6N0NSY6_9CREN|nr:hypothetical protein [Metallosphaera tengchongensis]QKQ99855.1 hypothetical protein GWK48_05155 [Metallosphaera tengchongensis]